ncbi:MAG: O-antigen ligase family protein [Ignavibacteriae bacterium]|nr:O-antigen ligase family protein [Ignavibacteriota bacterium]
MIDRMQGVQAAGASGTVGRRLGPQIFFLLALAIGGSAIAFLNLYLDGNLLATIGLVFIIAFVVVSIFRPSISLYLLVFFTLAVEQIVFDYGWTAGIPYHRNLNNIFPSLTGVAINPLELHFLCIIAGLILRFIIIKEERVRVIAWKQLWLYIGSILFFVAYGVYKGGEFLPALWEIRSIMYLVLLMVIVPQVIRTESQVRHMIWAIIAGLGSRAIEVTRHFAGADFSIAKSGGGWGNHEDAGMQASMLVFILAMRLYKADKKQNWALTFLLPLIVIAIIASDRRTAYPVLAGALVLFGVLQPPAIQKKIMSIGWKLGIVFIVYCAVFWNSRSDSILVMPVKNIKSGIAGDDQAQAAESYTSNLYRNVENWDLQKMITERPLLGTGYGVKIDYYMPIPLLWDLGFYIPHNQILAVMAKTGMVGFTIFVFFYLSVIAEIGFAFGKLIEEKYFHAVLVLAGAAVVNHLVFSSFDIILTYSRTNVYLGALLGVASTVIALQRKKREEEAAAAPAEPPPTPERHWLLLQPPEKVVVG